MLEMDPPHPKKKQQQNKITKQKTKQKQKTQKNTKKN
jgi:hypothetical protein